MIIRWGNKKNRSNFQSLGFVQAYYGIGPTALVDAILLFPTKFAFVNSGINLAKLKERGKTNISLSEEGIAEIKIRKNK